MPQVWSALLKALQKAIAPARSWVREPLRPPSSSAFPPGASAADDPQAAGVAGHRP